MAATSIETRSLYGELVKGVGVQFLEVANQSQLSYTLAMEEMLATPGNKYTSLAKVIRTDQSKVHNLQKTGVQYPSVTPEGTAFNTDTRLMG